MRVRPVFLLLVVVVVVAAVGMVLTTPMTVPKVSVEPWAQLVRCAEGTLGQLASCARATTTPLGSHSVATSRAVRPCGREMRIAHRRGWLIPYPDPYAPKQPPAGSGRSWQPCNRLP